MMNGFAEMWNKDKIQMNVLAKIWRPLKKFASFRKICKLSRLTFDEMEITWIIFFPLVSAERSSKIINLEKNNNSESVFGSQKIWRTSFTILAKVRTFLKDSNFERVREFLTPSHLRYYTFRDRQ